MKYIIAEKAIVVMLTLLFWWMIVCKALALLSEDSIYKFDS
jgi:hypothetical protein